MLSDFSCLVGWIKINSEPTMTFRRPKAKMKDEGLFVGLEGVPKYIGGAP